MMQVESSLRFYGMARQERSPVVSVLHYWVALEALAEGARVQFPDGTSGDQAAGAFLPPHTASLMALVATKNQLTHLWQLLRHLGRQQQRVRWRELEVWLGLPPGRKHVDLVKWRELLIAADGSVPAPSSLSAAATTAEAAAVVVELAERLGPFTRQRLAEVRSRFVHGAELGNWTAAMARSAEINLTRMKFMRHRAVHRAVYRDASSHQVRQAAHDIMDCVYEVLPRWLPGRSAPWEVFRDVRVYREQLARAWDAAGAGVPPVDPDKLVDP
jgi:hypothetical protein